MHRAHAAAAASPRLRDPHEVAVTADRMSRVKSQRGRGRVEVAVSAETPRYVVTAAGDFLRRVYDRVRDEHLVWTAVTLRTATASCCMCARPIAAGECAWKPITNGKNRRHRAHDECMETVGRMCRLLDAKKETR